jgi:drug/metabolite transporter (DMT)-like permease
MRSVDRPSDGLDDPHTLAPAGQFFFHEPSSLQNKLGIVLGVVGIVLVEVR